MENRSILDAIRANISQVLIGKQAAVDLLLTALLCQGHVLIEDVPGVGKTTLAQAFAASLGLSFQRIQFTPDVLPSDITGFNIYDLKRGTMVFQPGAIMKQVILADEINRSSPKTQSSLLEVMQENQVTVEGQTYPVPRPFMVLATQNPVEYAGTFPLPEAQLDRFLLRISLGYPSGSEEIQILRRHLDPPDVRNLPAVADQAAIEQLQARCAAVTVSEAVLDYIAQLAASTRRHAAIALGVSPRGGIALMRASRAWACLQDRDFVLPDDVQQMLQPVLAHRLILQPEAALDQLAIPRLLNEILRDVVVPAMQ